MMHGDIDNCSLHHMQQNLFNKSCEGWCFWIFQTCNEKCVDKTLFYKFFFFFFRQPLEYQVPLNLLICLASM